MLVNAPVGIIRQYINALNRLMYILLPQYYVRYVPVKMEQVIEDNRLHSSGLGRQTLPALCKHLKCEWPKTMAQDGDINGLFLSL